MAANPAEKLEEAVADYVADALDTFTPNAATRREALNDSFALEAFGRDIRRVIEAHLPALNALGHATEHNPARANRLPFSPEDMASMAVENALDAYLTTGAVRIAAWAASAPVAPQMKAAA